MKKLADEICKQIVDLYTSGEYTCEQIRRKLNLGSRVVNKTLKANGVKLYKRHKIYRKYTINENYFSRIDTEEKAYWLGLLYADGSHNEKSNQIMLGLTEPDKYILDKFNKDVGSNKPLGVEYRHIKNKKHQNFYKAIICSKVLSKDLRNLGIMQNKSLILQFPTWEQVPSNLRHHFIRGYFDGDGSFFTSSDNTIITIISSIDFCKRLKNIIEDGVRINTYLVKKGVSQKTGVLAISGRLQCCKFYEWISKGATIYFQRKYNKYLEAKNLAIKPRGKLYEIDGEYNNIKEWAKIYNASLNLVRVRLRKGWNIKDALTKKRLPSGRQRKGELC